MFISSIELEDIKSHRKFEQKFGSGTTAILGENGAGKTTLIEAVAWALFDYQPYKPIENFVRRGAKKGVVRLVFESRLDDKSYQIYRDTGGTYKIYNLEGKHWETDKGDETRGFLRKHLGVESGTDLETLFLSAIGVPQGTLTADFMLTAEPRKKKFDKLLRLDDYRESEKKLGERVGKLVKEKIENVRRKIAHAEGQLLRFDEISSEQNTLFLRQTELQTLVANVALEIEKRREVLEVLDETAQKIETLRNEKMKVEVSFETAKREQSRRQIERDKAFNANQRQAEIASDYKKHIAALEELKNLETRQTERNRRQTELNQIEREFLSLESEQKRVRENLEKSVSAKREIAELEPQVKQEKVLGAQKEILQKSVAEAKAAKKSLKNNETEVEHLRGEYRKNKKEVDEAEQKVGAAKNVETLGEQETQLTQQLADFRATFERDRKFQREVQNGLCPILSQRCLNLREGETLETYFTGQFALNTQKIKDLETETKRVSAELKTAREAEKFSVALVKLKETQAEITMRGKRLNTEETRLKELSEKLTQLENELNELDAKLKNLGNPAATVKNLEKEAERESEWRTKFEQISEKITQIEAQKQDSANKLKEFAGLDDETQKWRIERDSGKPAHDEFVRNQSLAESFPLRETELQEILMEIEQVSSKLQEVSQKFVEISQNYDADLHSREKNAMQQALLQKNSAETELRTIAERMIRLNLEIVELEKVRESLRGERQEEDRLRQAAEATEFIRDTLKKAAAPVGALLCFEISSEANRLFREITGRVKSTLQWEDGKDKNYDTYEITIEEEGHKRPFKNLSGGEQMAAALSVRLAMLKFLSSIRVAFFDEPTANLDPQRRELLAQQIQQIGENEDFEQLFVISHDDTFDEYVDNRIYLRKEES